ncbi:unnamed protein product [Arabidopsis halleri]
MVERAAEVDEISYALMEKVDCLMQNLENMEVKIGEGCQLPDRDQAAVKADEADEVSYALMEKVKILLKRILEEYKSPFRFVSELTLQAYF